MFKEVTLQNIWESDMPVENGSTFKIKSTLWWPVLVEGLSLISATSKRLHLHLYRNGGYAILSIHFMAFLSWSFTKQKCGFIQNFLS
jgi:hypothetical protein